MINVLFILTGLTFKRRGANVPGKLCTWSMLSTPISRMIKRYNAYIPDLELLGTCTPNFKSERKPTYVCQGGEIYLITNQIIPKGEPKQSPDKKVLQLKYWIP